MYADGCILAFSFFIVDTESIDSKLLNITISHRPFKKHPSEMAIGINSSSCHYGFEIIYVC